MKFTKMLPILLFWFWGCSQAPDQPVTIAINPWPGYEPMYLAEVQGYFEQNGINVELVQLDSLSDVQRAYLNGHVDGMASTMIEAVQASHLGNKPLKIIMVPDYSNGGDVLIGATEFNSVAQLKGKRVGVEVSSLGIYVLHRALSKHGMTLDDVELVNTKQERALNELNAKNIDAVVTYPPFSVEILKSKGYEKLFTSAEIPFEIIDVISVSESVLKTQPDFVPRLRASWQMALDYMAIDPARSMQIMAEREGISVEDFEAALGDLIVLNASQQRELFQRETLQEAVIDVCEVLVGVNSIETNCDQLSNIIYDK